MENNKKLVCPICGNALSTFVTGIEDDPSFRKGCSHCRWYTKSCGSAEEAYEEVKHFITLFSPIRRLGYDDVIKYRSRKGFVCKGIVVGRRGPDHDDFYVTVKNMKDQTTENVVAEQIIDYPFDIRLQRYSDFDL